MFSGRSFLSGPPVVKNLIMINIIMLLAYYAGLQVFGVDLNGILGLYYPKSDRFMPIQILTHMFMHAGIWHLFFNMYALYIFGQILENVWGSQRFLLYYLVCGLGAAFIHEAVIGFQFHQILNTLTPEQTQLVLSEGAEVFKSGKVYTDINMQALQVLLNTPTVGASGAIFGVLLAFGMLFPNTQLMLLIPPIPIKAKWFVLIYGVLELYLAISQPGSNVAHAAHLGGMLFGFIMIKYWQKRTNTLY